MKKLLAIVLLCAIPAYAAMSDPSALKQAKNLWGPLGAIGYAPRISTDSNWLRQVGVKTTGCQQPFLVLGQGTSQWENAFNDAAAHPVAIAGPFKSTVNFKLTAWDNVSVVKVDLIIDGLPLNTTLSLPPSPQWDVSIPINTTLLANGIHTVCAKGVDQADHIGLGQALLFSVDQSITAITPEWILPQKAAPSMSMPASLTALFRGIFRS